jgi:hypothetical protein
VSACRHPDTKTDHRLLDETRAGQAESFEVLYRRHHAVVLTYLARRTNHPELAADLMATRRTVHLPRALTAGLSVRLLRPRNSRVKFGRAMQALPDQIHLA